MGHDVRTYVAVGAGRLSLTDLNWWPSSSDVLRMTFVLSAGHALSAIVRDSILRVASPSDGARIRVPPMSDTWLRTHETEYGKHGAEP
jgi:hypothetical protein